MIQTGEHASNNAHYASWRIELPSGHGRLGTGLGHLQRIVCVWVYQLGRPEGTIYRRWFLARSGRNLGVGCLHRIEDDLGRNGQERRERHM